ncbi:hypothetical protein EJB05_40695, partial [Eragrostis curvula]
GRTKSRGSRGGDRRRGKSGRVPSPSPSPSVHDSGEEEEDEREVGEEREVEEELPSVNGSETSEDEEGEAPEEPSSVFSRGPAQLPSRLIPVDRRPVIRPVLPRSWDVITPGDHDRPPNGILGILCRQWYPGVGQYKGKQEPALTWDHYKVAQNLPDSGSRCFAHKAERVMMELWDFFRCEPGMEEVAARVVNKVCQKLVPNMWYEARIQAVINYHAQVHKTTVNKAQARTMQLTRAQYLLVPPSWLATHHATWEFMARRWCDPEWWEQTHKAARERRLKMAGPAHHQGSQSLNQYAKKWSAAHGGQPCGQFMAFALAHKGKAESEVSFNPEDPPSAYSNATVHSRISQYTAAARQVHGEDWDPSTHDLDGELVMRVGGGKKHGRYWIGDSTLDTASTPTLSQIRARSTDSAPPIRPRPTATQIQIEQVQASMEVKMEEKLREERERYEALMRSQMQAMFTYIQSTGAPPPPPDLFPGLAGGVPPPGGVTPPSGASPAATPFAEPIRGIQLSDLTYKPLDGVATSMNL